MTDPEDPKPREATDSNPDPSPRVEGLLFIREGEDPVEYAALVEKHHLANDAELARETRVEGAEAWEIAYGEYWERNWSWLERLPTDGPFPTHRDSFRAGFLARTASPPISATGGGEGAWRKRVAKIIFDHTAARHGSTSEAQRDWEDAYLAVDEILAALARTASPPISATGGGEDWRTAALQTLEDIRTFMLHPAPEYVTECRHLTTEGMRLVADRARNTIAAALQPGGASAAPEGWVKRAAASIAHMVDEWTQRGWNDEGRAKFAALIERRLNRFAAAPSPPAASAEPHRNEVCINCGNTQDIGALTAAGYVSCCPERDMRPSNEFRHQGAASAEDKS